MVSIRAADAPLRLPLIHGHVRLPQRARDHRPVEQVARTHPQPPLRNDVESEPGGVLVELADPRVDARRIELRAGQLVHRGHDADVGRAGDVAAAEHLGQLADVTSADVPGPGLGHRLRYRQPGRAGDRARACCPRAPMTRESGPGHAANDAGNDDRPSPPGHRPRLVRCHPQNVPARRAAQRLASGGVSWPGVDGGTSCPRQRQGSA